MKKIIKRAAISGTRKIPATRRYLAEKEALQIKFIEQQTKIQNLEKGIQRAIEQNTQRGNKKPHIIFISNQLDATGAPLIFMDLVKDFVKEHPKALYEFHTFNPVDHSYLKKLRDLGLKPQVHADRDITVETFKGDVIVLNTVAHSDRLKNSIYDSLETGIATKLIWYMHEDWPEIFFSEPERKRINKLLDVNKIAIFIPAARALENHKKLYAGKKIIHRLPYRLNIPVKYHQIRSAEEFNKLTFLMIGKTGGGIKGHLPILYAFLNFKRAYYDKNPDAYRDFELCFVGIEGDYLSLQILRHAPKLGVHFRHYPPLPHDEALRVIKNSNVTICYSIRENLPVFVFEGMIMGHPILRNDVSGMEEQLLVGKNGLLLDSNNYQQVVDTLERILNQKTTTNEDLSRMSAVSYDIALKQKSNTYEPLIRVAWKSFTS